MKKNIGLVFVVLIALILIKSPLAHAWADTTVTSTVVPETTEDDDCLAPGQPDLDNSSDDVICVSLTPSATPTDTPAPTDTPTAQTSDGQSDGRSDGLGCGSHDCSTHPVSVPLAPNTGRGEDR